MKPELLKILSSWAKFWSKNSKQFFFLLAEYKGNEGKQILPSRWFPSELKKTRTVSAPWDPNQLILKSLHISERTVNIRAAEKDLVFWRVVLLQAWQQSTLSLPSLNPTILRGKHKDISHMNWQFNKKSWVTANTFSDWFHKCYEPKVEQLSCFTEQ